MSATELKTRKDGRGGWYVGAGSDLIYAATNMHTNYL